MHARVSTLTGDPSRADEAIEFSRGQGLSWAREMAGFKGLLTLLDREQGRVLNITFWESEEAMKASEEQANRIRESAASTAGGEIAGVDRYEVVVQEMPG